MKRSLRSLFLLLLLLSTFLTYLFSSFAITSCFFLPPKCNHATLLSLSTHDASTKLFVQSEVSDLLQASIESFDTYGGIHRTISLWGRIRSDISDRRKSLARIRLPISPQNGYPPDRHVILPLFRQTLAEWAHHHSLKFSDSITIDLIQHVKNPIEIFSGRPNTGEPYSSCAVVGNSGILVGSNHGELIDSHGFVIRLNNAKIIGYEKDVGSKTSLSFVNSNILHLCTRREKCYCHPYGETVPVLMYICQPNHFLDYVICNYSHKAPLLITDPRFDNLCTRIAKYYSLKRFVDSTGQSPTRWNETREETTFHYSSGLQAVMLALGICKRVSIFGFGKLKGAKHHYHTNQKGELDLHDYEAEYMFYRDLIQRPEMIPFLAEFRVPHLVFYH